MVAKIIGVIAATIASLSFCTTRVCAEQKYVGLSLCSPELQSSGSTFRVGLDRTRHAYIVYKELPKKKLVMIVVYVDQNDQCGLIRDAREFRNSRNVFTEDCVDVLHPGEVVVGLFDQKFDPKHPERSARLRGSPVQNWEIDLRNFRFLWKSTSDVVTCRIQVSADNDDGTDLATTAHQRLLDASGVGREKIVIRMLNGRNGKPVDDEIPNVWIGSSNPINGLRGSHLGFHTDSKGEIQIDVTDVQPRELRIAPDYYVDCRFAGDKFNGDEIRYALEEIIAKGIVGDNLCGTPHVQPVRGVLILYLRPRTWKEKRDL